MSANLTAEIFQDEIAISLARAITVANQRARDLGVDIVQSLITITQRSFQGKMLWRINYGPKDYVGPPRRRFADRCKSG